jgi:hypothetical protein
MWGRRVGGIQKVNGLGFMKGEAWNPRGAWLGIREGGATHYCENPLPQKGAECAKETILSFLRFLRLSFII